MLLWIVFAKLHGAFKIHFNHSNMETSRERIQIDVNENVTLCEICLDDAAEVFRVINTEREYLGKWLPFVQNTRSINDTVDFITYSMAAAITMDELVFKITYNGDFAGLIGFRNADKQRRHIELGYWLGEQFQHKGIVTQCVTVVSNLIFTRFGFCEVLIKCAVENYASRKIPESTGFSFVKIEPQAEQLSDGSFTDIAVYSLKY